MLTMLAGIVFAALMIKAGLGDVRSLQISNRLVLITLAAYAVFAPLADVPLVEIGTSLAAATAILAMGICLFALGLIGGGDAKMAAVAALWLGAAHILPFIVYTAFAGGLLAAMVIAFRHIPVPAGWQQPEWAERLRSPTAGLPYGVAIAAGALLVLGDTGWLNGHGF